MVEDAYCQFIQTADYFMYGLWGKYKSYLFLWLNIYAQIYIKYMEKDMEKQVFWWCKYRRKLIQVARYEILCQIL